MSIDLTTLSREDMAKLLSKQSRKMIRVANELQIAYRRLALHACTGKSCSKCKGGEQ